MSEIIFGIHAVQALLERDPQRFQEVFILKGRDDRRLQPVVAALEAQGIVIQLAERKWLDSQVEGGVHQGIVARVKPGRQYQEGDLPDLLQSLDKPFLLVLDGVTDPHNLGACLRSADAAGVHAIIVPKDRSAPLNATAKKVASGAAENVPLIRVTNLARTLRLLQEYNIWVVGTAGEADHTVFQSKMTGPMALVIHTFASCSIRMVRARLVTRISGTFSAAPLATFFAVALSCAERSFGTITACTPAASALRRQAPRLCGSVTPSRISRKGVSSFSSRSGRSFS